MHDRTPISLMFIFIFSICGIAFSGYLFLTSLVLGRHALSESAQIFLGVPAFYSGLLLFAVLITLSVYVHKRRISFEHWLMSTTAASFIGIMFAMFLTFKEMPTFLKYGFTVYTYAVPTSFIDLVFFMLVFVTGAVAWSYEHDHNR